MVLHMSFHHVAANRRNVAAANTLRPTMQISSHTRKQKQEFLPARQLLERTLARGELAIMKNRLGELH